MSTNTPEQTNTTSQPNRFRISPVLDIPKDAIKVYNMDKEGRYSASTENYIEWSSLHDAALLSTKQVEADVIAVMISKRSRNSNRGFSEDGIIVVNDRIVLRDERLESADINKNGQMVYVLDGAVFTKDIYDSNHRVLSVPPIKQLTSEESQEKREKEKQEFEQAPKYPSILQGPFITSSGHVVIIGTKKGDEGTHLYIDNQEIPLDIHNVNDVPLIESENIFISFKTPVGENRITKIELDNSRERPKKGDYLIEGYRALTQQQFRRVMDLEEQRDNLMDLHDDKITKLTDKNTEIAQLRRLLDQEKEKTEALIDRIDRMENAIMQQKEQYEQDISEMNLVHGGIVTVINESLVDLGKAIEKPGTFGGNLKEQAIVASQRIKHATAQIKHAQ